jgi:anaerobic selenocysteine-containing dehydrogenase
VMAIYTTACPRNCYSTCGMRVTVEKGRLVRLEAHPDNQATSEGLCLKGLSYIERVYAADRLLHPLRRQPGGGFARVGWAEALDEIAGRLRRLREEHGPRSLFFYAGSGTKGLMNGVALEFWRLFGGCTTTYGDLCWPAGLEATRLTLGENKHSVPWDLADARLIILWGKNPAETNIHQMRFVEQARERGARVVVIDPRRTQSAESADLLLRIEPGTDGALALGLAHLLVSRGDVDHEFVERHVSGFESFREMLVDYPPRRVAGITGLPVEAIERLALDVGGIAPLTICAGFGMQRYTNSAQTMRSILALLAITGNLGKPGAGWVYANLQSHVFDEVRDPVACYPPEGDEDPVRVSISTALLGRQLPEQTDPPIRMAWVERGNPVTQNPETGRVLEALRALDFRVVVDQFLTDTAREADIVLPAKTLFEQADVINAYWHPYLQIKDKLIEPPGEVKPESEIYRLLAARLGLPEAEVARRIPEATDEGVERYLEQRLAEVPGAASAGLSLERLRLGPVLPPGHQEIAWSDHVFPTPSGRIELFSREARDRWGADPLPRYRAPAESPRSGSDSPAEHPLHLLTPNTKDRIHSQFNNLPSIRELHPVSRVHLHPADAAGRGIEEGARVRIFNDRGALELEAVFDRGLRRGCVSVTNGWWLSDGGGVNLLSRCRETDMGHGAAFHDNAVQVELA